MYLLNDTFCDNDVAMDKINNFFSELSVIFYCFKQSKKTSCLK